MPLLALLGAACAGASTPRAVVIAPASPIDAGVDSAAMDDDAAGARGSARAGDPAPALSVEEAVALARRWDADALEGFRASRSPDFAAAGFAPKGVLYGRLSDGAACRAIPYETFEGGLSGDVSRTWREGGDVITEGYDLRLGWTADLLGPGRTVVHADKTTSTSATGSAATLGTFRDGAGGRLRYDGCAMSVQDVRCGATEEVIHDACGGGPRSCVRCTRVSAKLRSVGSCGVRALQYPSLRRTVHDCEPCEGDPLGNVMEELRRALVGQTLVREGSGTSFFTTRAACEAAR
jgi:hypothetical protein